MENRAQRVGKIQNYVVARYRDGRVVKGVTHDFGTQKKAFHVVSVREDKRGSGGKVSEVFLSDLKPFFL